MQPSITSPVPVILFDDGMLTVKAVYHSGHGAPMESAAVVAMTSSTSVAGTVAIDGESITGTVPLSHIQSLDVDWEIGDSLTIVVRTQERGAWSETRYTAATCGAPDVAITSGGDTVYGFPHEVNWAYTDYDGFYQQGYSLRISGSDLVGDVVLSGYSSGHSVVIDGSEIAYGAEIGGTATALSCELEVMSTSGLSTIVEFELSMSPNGASVAPTAAIEDGRMAVDVGAPFFLYVLKDGLDRCAWSDTGYLDFALPVPDARWFAVTLDENRVGRADEVHPTGTLESSYIDYVDDGVARRVDIVHSPSQSYSGSVDMTLASFAGREDPVAYFQARREEISVKYTAMEPVDAESVQRALRGKEVVYRSYDGAIRRAVVGSPSLTSSIASTVSGEMSIPMTVVDGSPYALLYDSPLFADAQVYPSDTTYPATNLWAVA